MAIKMAVVVVWEHEDALVFVVFLLTRSKLGYMNLARMAHVYHAARKKRENPDFSAPLAPFGRQKGGNWPYSVDENAKAQALAAKIERKFVFHPS